MALWGKTDANISKPKWLDRGQIVAINVVSGGTGYVSAPTVTVSAPASGTRATATANLNGGGSIGSITITNPGAGYAATDTVTVTFSTGAATAAAVYHGAAYADGTIYFVDNAEANVTANRNRGFKGPGWWLYKTYTDAQGRTRHKANQLVAINVTAAAAGDLATGGVSSPTGTVDDTVLADA